MDTNVTVDVSAIEIVMERSRFRNSIVNHCVRGSDMCNIHHICNIHLKLHVG